MQAGSKTSTRDIMPMFTYWKRYRRHNSRTLAGHMRSVICYDRLRNRWRRVSIIIPVLPNMCCTWREYVEVVPLQFRNPFEFSFSTSTLFHHNLIPLLYWAKQATIEPNLLRNTAFIFLCFPDKDSRNLHTCSAPSVVIDPSAGKLSTWGNSKTVEMQQCCLFGKPCLSSSTRNTPGSLAPSSPPAVAVSVSSHQFTVQRGYTIILISRLFSFFSPFLTLTRTVWSHIPCRIFKAPRNLLSVRHILCLFVCLSGL